MKTISKITANLLAAIGIILIVPGVIIIGIAYYLDNEIL